MVGRPKGVKSKTSHNWNKEEKDYLSEITPGKSYNEILELMNSKFEYQFSLSQVKGAIKRYKLNTGKTGRFEKGHVPVNKGTKGLTGANKMSFRKGNIPVNHKPIGSERVNVDGYTEIKVSEPNKWRLKHQVIWESHNGKIPSGSAILFSDGDKSNLDINNLVLISKSQLLVLNKNNLIKQDSELTKVGINIANVMIKISESKKRK